MQQLRGWPGHCGATPNGRSRTGCRIPDRRHDDWVWATTSVRRADGQVLPARACTEPGDSTSVETTHRHHALGVRDRFAGADRVHSAGTSVRRVHPPDARRGARMRHLGRRSTSSHQEVASWRRRHLRLGIQSPYAQSRSGRLGPLSCAARHARCVY